MKSEGEEKIKQEDCSEDSLGSGILTLTNRRVAFDKSKGRIMDFTKRFEDTVMDVSLGDITKVWKEGLIMKKVCLSAKKGGGSTNQGGEEQIYKFGVFSTGNWLENIQDAMHDFKNQ